MRKLLEFFFVWFLAFVFLDFERKKNRRRHFQLHKVTSYMCIYFRQENNENDFFILKCKQHLILLLNFQINIYISLLFEMHLTFLNILIPRPLTVKSTRFTFLSFTKTSLDQFLAKDLS